MSSLLEPQPALLSAAAPLGKEGYGDFHFIDWQPAEVIQTCLMSQEDRLTKCKTFLDAPGAGVNTFFTPSGMLLIERRGGFEFQRRHTVRTLVLTPLSGAVGTF